MRAEDEIRRILKATGECEEDLFEGYWGMKARRCRLERDRGDKVLDGVICNVSYNLHVQENNAADDWMPQAQERNVVWANMAPGPVSALEEGLNEVRRLEGMFKRLDAAGYTSSFMKTWAKTVMLPNREILFEAEFDYFMMDRNSPWLLRVEDMAEWKEWTAGNKEAGAVLGLYVYERKPGLKQICRRVRYADCHDLAAAASSFERWCFRESPDFREALGNDYSAYFASLSEKERAWLVEEKDGVRFKETR